LTELNYKSSEALMLALYYPSLTRTFYSVIVYYQAEDFLLYLIWCLKSWLSLQRAKRCGNIPIASPYLLPFFFSPRAFYALSYGQTASSQPHQVLPTP
jgi:hypothetical protein